MEQITITLDRAALEQLPASVLVTLLMGQPEEPVEEIYPLDIEINNELFSLFPAETHVKPQNTDKRWSNRDDLNLIYGYSKGHLSDKALAEMLQRTVSSVTNRIRRLKAAGKL
jgi:hypothetical protein